MFSKEIVGSDAFLDMPTSSQLLYFHLGMEADDDGFIGNPKKVSRFIGASDDDLKILLSKKFLLLFETGVVVVKHHRINNNWDKYNCKRTVYLEEFNQLNIKENKAYTLDKAQGINVQTDNRLTTVFRIEENRIEENRIEEDMSATADGTFDRFWKEYPKKELKKKTQEIWKRKKLSPHLEEILKFISSAKNTDRWKKGFIKQPPVFLNNEAWNDDLSSYGDVQKVQTYKNKTDNNMIDKLKAKTIKNEI